jgi:hypothetical protein
MNLHIEFLVEELSMKEALQNLLPKILGETTSFDVHPYQGKRDLIDKLPHRLKRYKSWLPDEYRIVVLIDEDREDCQLLKKELEKIAIDAGFSTKSSVEIGQKFQVLNRVTVEELESWFFGDIAALISAYPGVSPHLGNKAQYRNPDAIKGGTWEALEKVL